MITIPAPIRWAIEPTIATLFLLDSIFSEVGRNGSNVIAWLPFVVIAVSIGMSRVSPLIAIGLPFALVILQYCFLPLRFGDTGWPAYFGIALTLTGVLVSATRPLRQVAVLILGLVSLLIAGLPYWGGSDLIVSIGIHQERIPLAVTVIAALVATGLSWVIAFGLRAALHIGEADTARQRAIAELRETEGELSMAVERDRIAQDIHDIMAHSLSVIVAQADGARFVGNKRPGTINQSLESIALAARESLTEVRMLIDTLVSEPEGHSHPSLKNIDGLIERVTSAGLTVSVSIFGEPQALTSGQELAVYRIVQEAVTNSLKHSGSKPTARVILDWRGVGLALNISSKGVDSPPSANPTAENRGIYGMRERARLAGGWLTASQDDEGQEFLVTAFIPSLSSVGSDARAAVGATL
jgi:signal transduction histidine kinase